MSLLKKGNTIEDHFFIGYDLHKAGISLAKDKFIADEFFDETF